MRLVLRGPLLDLAASAFLVLTVGLVACASSSVSELREPGRAGRWVALAGLAAAGLATVVRHRRAGLAPGRFAVVAAMLGGLALASAAWSAVPSLTFQRAVSFGVLLLAAWTLGTVAAVRPELGRSLLVALVGAAGLVALAGIAVYLTRPDAAVQAAEISNPGRFRGFGENPNTMPMLFAIALPAGVWLAVSAGGRRARLIASAVALLLVGSIGASGSRGAMLAAFAGALLVLAGSLRGRRLLVGLAAAGALLVLSVALSARPGQNEVSAQSVVPAAPSPARPGGGLGPGGRVLAVPLENDPNELGRPRPGVRLVTYHRTLLGSSGRAQAWDGAIRQSMERPLLGYGFGTEERVFDDRYYVFQGARPENSYIGLALQLGFAGLGLFLLGTVLLVIVVFRCVGGWQRSRPVPLACAGIVASGLVLALIQSYVYSVGNVATVSFWLAAFMLGAAPRPQESE